MSLSQDDEPKPETGLATPERAAHPAEDSVGSGGAVDPVDRSLTHDVDEVERGRPERAFNIGATLGILVTVAAVIFVLQNRQSTTSTGGGSISTCLCGRRSWALLVSASCW